MLGAVVVLMSLYVLNAVGNISVVKDYIGGRRYLYVLWAMIVFYLLVSRFSIDRDFFVQKFCLLLPVGIACVVLYFYHRREFDLGFLKYAVLLISAASVVSRASWFNRKIFFRLNSISCLVIFIVAFYQLECGHRLIPNGGINTNIFAPQVMIIGAISAFSLFYNEINYKERCAHVLCGVLALWVALRTGCRTAYVAEVAMVILFGILSYRKYHCSLNCLLFSGMAVVMAMLMAVIFSPMVIGDKFNRIFGEVNDFLVLQSGQTTDTSIGLRLAMWKTALMEIIPKNFWFGVGEVASVNFVNLDLHTSIDKKFLATIGHFHNEEINIFVTGGVLLFGTANWLLYRLFKIARTEPVLLAILVGTLVFGMTEITWLHRNSFLTFVSVSLLYECARKNNEVESAEYKN